jgi:carbon monoxide dehydrogenase subunit G
MKVPIEIERSLDIPMPLAQVKHLYDDIEGTIRRFPKLKKLTKLGDNAYLWEMETMGSRAAKVAAQISYGARYSVDAKAGKLSWKPVPRQGNATIEGAFEMKGDARRTRLSFRVTGELHDVPVPLIYRLLAAPFIQGKFTRLVDTFLERTREALVSGEVA